VTCWRHCREREGRVSALEVPGTSKHGRSLPVTLPACEGVLQRDPGCMRRHGTLRAHSAARHAPSLEAHPELPLVVPQSSAHDLCHFFSGDEGLQPRPMPQACEAPRPGWLRQAGWPGM